jgi:hypothetical protein
MAKKHKKVVKTRQVPLGQLARTIVRAISATDEAVNARELAGLLDFWGITVDPRQVALRLPGLKEAGRIKWVARGRYARINPVHSKQPPTRRDYKRLPRGELTRIIIDTVCCCETGEGINAAELTAKLNSWTIMVTKAQMTTRLNELARAGAIERVSLGRYKGA